MHFCFEHAVSLPRDQVFAFFENPERIEVLYAGWSNLRLLHCETQVSVGAETWVEVTVAGFVPMVLGFRHCLFKPPLRFGEVAIHGPFSRFIHIHEFESQDGKTIVRDLLEVCLPWHYGGEATMKSVVGRAITQMFHRRAEALSSLVSDGTVARSGLRRLMDGCAKVS